MALSLTIPSHTHFASVDGTLGSITGYPSPYPAFCSPTHTKLTAENQLSLWRTGLLSQQAQGESGLWAPSMMPLHSSSL